MTGWNLPPGVTDRMIDEAAQGGVEPVQCDNCCAMFDPEEEGCFIGWHSSYGDCCQCAKCCDNAGIPKENH